MFVFQSPESHRQHNPKFEFELGKFVSWKELPDRIDSINNRLTLRKDTIFVENPLQDHGKEPILAVHKQEYIDYLQTAYQKWVSIGGNPEGVMPDVFAVRDFANPKKSHLESSPETRIVQGDAGYYSFDFCSVLVDGTFQAAYDAVQTALTAADHLSEEIKKGASLPSVFALIRPPGHHSHTDLCGGYCFFNNAAIVTKYCRDVLNLGKITILDLDYHHGNGTQSIFYSESNPMYVSLHGTPDYPFWWGSKDEQGEGDGMSFNVNRPLPQGTQDPEYLETLACVINDKINPYKPDLLVVSLGFDTFKLDPVGAFFLTTDCYEKIGRLVRDINVPTIIVLEGGYCVEYLGENCSRFFDGFLQKKE